MRSHLPQPHLPLLARLPAPRSVLLALLVLATLVMPVNYRAGADREHTHTIFQGLIDTVVGHPHQHGATAPANDHPSSISPFASLAIPLAALVSADSPTVSPASSESDTPSLLGLSMPISALSAIQALSLLIAALLAGVSSRPLWQSTVRLLDRAFGEDPPPPRLT